MTLQFKNCYFNELNKSLEAFKQGHQKQINYLKIFELQISRINSRILVTIRRVFARVGREEDPLVLDGQSSFQNFVQKLVPLVFAGVEDHLPDVITDGMTLQDLKKRKRVVSLGSKVLRSKILRSKVSWSSVS